MGRIYTLKQTFGTKYQELGQGLYTTRRSPCKKENNRLQQNLDGDLCVVHAEKSHL